MKKLKKHKLNFDRTFPFVEKSLDEINTLSSKLLELIDFKNGSFFTLLPDDANFARIYEFEGGLVLPQHPEQKHKNGSAYTIIPTIKKELSTLIFKKMKSETELNCIFDDVLRYVTDKYHMELFDSHGLFYKNEVYYLLKKNKISIKLIMECLRKSDANWHSLCVFTKSYFTTEESKELNLDKLLDICLNTSLIMVGAYDGEGYVFWERHES